MIQSYMCRACATVHVMLMVDVHVRRRIFACKIVSPRPWRTLVVSRGLAPRPEATQRAVLGDAALMRLVRLRACARVKGRRQLHQRARMHARVARV